MQELIIFPYSGTGKEALDCLGKDFKCVGFVTDDDSLIGSFYNEIEIFSRDIFIQKPSAKVLAVPGSPSSFLKRKAIIENLNIEDSRFAKVIHPKAYVSSHSNIGFNTLIMAGVVITSNAKIGNHVCVLPNSVIHHDSVVGNYTLIAAGNVVSGDVNIGENCYVGAGCSIINGCTIGSKSLIGIGSNVIRNIPENKKYAGNPAKELTRK